MKEKGHKEDKTKSDGKVPEIGNSQEILDFMQKLAKERGITLTQLLGQSLESYNYLERVTRLRQRRSSGTKPECEIGLH